MTVYFTTYIHCSHCDHLQTNNMGRVSQLKTSHLLIPGDHACAAAWDAATDGNDERGRPTALLQTAQGRCLGVFNMEVA